jgi:hypothetical protein
MKKFTRDRVVPRVSPVLLGPIILVALGAP